MPEFYTAQEAAPILGVSEKTIRKRITRGEIPASKKTLPNGAEAWQIPAEWVTERSGSNPVETMPELLPEPAHLPPEHATIESETLPEPIPEAAGSLPVELIKRLPEDTGSVPPEVIAEHESRLARLEGIHAAQFQQAIERMSETNRELLARLEAIEAAQSSQVEKIAHQVATVTARAVNAENEIKRLRDELEKEQGRTWWDKLRGK